MAHRQDRAPEPDADHAERAPQGSLPDRCLRPAPAAPVRRGRVNGRLGRLADEPAPADADHAAVDGDARAHRRGGHDLRRRRAAVLGELVGGARQLLPEPAPRRARSPTRRPAADQREHADHAHVQQAGVAGARRVDATGLAPDVRRLAQAHRPFDSVPAPRLRLRARRQRQHRAPERCPTGRRPSRSATRGAAGRCRRGSTLRLQQLLAMLGYLPLRFRYAGTGPRPDRPGQLEAAVKPRRRQLHLALPEHPRRAREDAGSPARSAR